MQMHHSPSPVIVGCIRGAIVTGQPRGNLLPRDDAHLVHVHNDVVRLPVQLPFPFQINGFLVAQLECLAHFQAHFVPIRVHLILWKEIGKKMCCFLKFSF